MDHQPSDAADLIAALIKRVESLRLRRMALSDEIESLTKEVRLVAEQELHAQNELHVAKADRASIPLPTSKDITAKNFTFVKAWHALWSELSRQGPQGLYANECTAILLRAAPNSKASTLRGYLLKLKRSGMIERSPRGWRLSAVTASASNASRSGGRG